MNQKGGSWLHPAQRRNSSGYIDAIGSVIFAANICGYTVVQVGFPSLACDTKFFVGMGRDNNDLYSV